MRGPYGLLLSRWTGWGWSAIAATTAFIAVACWWISQDRGVPFADAGSHLYTAIAYHDLLSRGDLGDLFHRSGYYPPLTFLVGGLATFVGGVNADAPIIGENLVYVSLLALGCYGAGRLVAGPAAGFLAVLFALGSPLLIEQMHVFMIDAPLAGLVAASVWLILLSDRFRRVGVAALAGLAVGAGTASKEQFPLFIVGLLAVVLLRGVGWRNWRGILAFAVVAAVVAAPWYVVNLSHLGHYAAAAGGDPEHIPARGRPPLLSTANLGWYLWAVLNGLLFAPLFAFAAVGVARAVRVSARRERGREEPAWEQGLRRHGPELLAGLAGGWLAISLTPHHDMRYTLPLLVYLAVLGTSWIPSLRGSQRTVATALLGAAVLATTLGATFGVGARVHVSLPGARTVAWPSVIGKPVPTDASYGIPPRNDLTLYSDHDFNVSAPRRADDIAGLLERMRQQGATGIAWRIEDAPLGDPVLDSQGLSLLARFAGLQRPERFWTVHFIKRDPPPGLRDRWNVADPRHVFLVRSWAEIEYAPCVRLSDGTGLFFVLGDAEDPEARPYCPLTDAGRRLRGPAGTAPAPRR